MDPNARVPSGNPGELGVRRRVDFGLDLQRERFIGRLRDGEPLGRGGVTLARRLDAVDLERGQRHFIAVEHQWRRRNLRVRPQRQGRAHARGIRMQRDVEVDCIHEPVGLAIIGEADGLGDVGAHAL